MTADMREAFEGTIGKQFTHDELHNRCGNYYEKDEVQYQFEAFQAGAAWQAAQVVQTERVKDLEKENSRLKEGLKLFSSLVAYGWIRDPDNAGGYREYDDMFIDPISELAEDLLKGKSVEQVLKEYKDNGGISNS